MMFLSPSISLWAILLATSPCAQTLDSLHMTIGGPSAVVSAEAPVVLRVFVWNDTDRPVQVIAPLNWPNESTVLEVIGPDGKRVEAYNFRFPYEVPVGPEAQFATRIPPHSFIGKDIQLTPGPSTGRAGYDLSRPGSYQATLNLIVYPIQGGKTATLRSDTVAWEVR